MPMNPDMNPETEAAVEKIIALARDKRRRKGENANQGKAEPPRPLMRELPPAEPFPVDALGDVLGPAAGAIHDRVQAPMAICAQSVLGPARLVTQAYANIELPIGGKRVKPMSSYLITIAESGSGKLKLIFKQVGQFESMKKAFAKSTTPPCFPIRMTKSRGRKRAMKP